MSKRELFADKLAIPLSFLNIIYDMKMKFQKGTIPILFHNPSLYLFESIIKHFLSAGYAFISIDDAVNYALDKDADKSRKSICITIDDGWRENLKNVIPIIRKYRIPITIFVTTEPLQSGCFWWEKVKYFSSYEPSRLKKISNKDRCLIIEEIDSRYAERYEDRRSALTIEELCRVANIDLITIGSHTVNHPCMNMTSHEEDIFEIYESKRLLENYIQKEVKHFAYPNGDYKETTVDLVKKAGYKSASVVNYGFIEYGCDQYLLNRNPINEQGGLRENLCHAYSSWRIVGGISSIMNR